MHFVHLYICSFIYIYIFIFAYLHITIRIYSLQRMLGWFVWVLLVYLGINLSYNKKWQYRNTHLLYVLYLRVTTFAFGINTVTRQFNFLLKFCIVRFLFLIIFTFSMILLAAKINYHDCKHHMSIANLHGLSVIRSLELTNCFSA